MLLIVIAIVVVLAYALYFSLHLTKRRLQLTGIPHPPLDTWLGGHLYTIKKAKAENRFLDVCVGWVAEYGDTWLFWLRKTPFVFTSDPHLMKQICTDLKTFTKVDKLPIRSIFKQKIIGRDSILSGSGLAWAVKRKSLTSFFAKTNMANLFDVCKPHMETYQRVRLQNVVGEGATVDLLDELAYILLSYLEVLGLEKFSSPKDIASDTCNILGAMAKHDHSPFYRTKLQKETIHIIQKRRDGLTDLIFQKYGEMTSNSENKLSTHDLVGHIIQANYKFGSKINGIPKIIDLSVDDMMTVILVMDNMVKQLTSMFMFLNDVPEVQKKMFEELREKPVTDYASLNDLKYTEKCLLESLRMGPALLRGTRNYVPAKRKSNQTLGPYNVKKNGRVRIIFSEWVMHYNELYWPNARKFDPERWADGFTPEHVTYLPFFAGPRGCLGKHMAMMMMKLTLSVLVQNFDITQMFSKASPPMILQEYAIMRISNKVDCYIKPR